jgi:hypothetical protein
MGTPPLRATIAGASLGTEDRSETGGTVVRGPREETAFQQIRGSGRQDYLVIPRLPN